MMTDGVVLLHDNGRPHTSRAARTRALLEHLTRSCLATLLTALISLRATIYLPEELVSVTAVQK
jgi:hypothetical protein